MSHMDELRQACHHSNGEIEQEDGQVTCSFSDNREITVQEDHTVFVNTEAGETIHKEFKKAISTEDGLQVMAEDGNSTVYHPEADKIIQDEKELHSIYRSFDK